MDIQGLFEGGLPAGDIIGRLKEKSVTVPEWSELAHDYEPTLHRITKDTNQRKDKPRSDGTLDKASRIHIGLERLLTKRMTEFMFAIPVRRVYHNIDGDERRQGIAKAMEAIYKNARIDAENIRRGNAYFASCEVFTMWYAEEKPNTLYGFPSRYKLKCKSFYPMNEYAHEEGGVTTSHGSPVNAVWLYPLLDEYGDMGAMSFEYTRKVIDERVTFFETLTADRHYRWRQRGGEWEQLEEAAPLALGKIPGAYIWRPEPIWHGLSHIREEIEYTLSRNSDVIAYNSAPVLKVTGRVSGREPKGEAQRVIRLEDGGDVSYVSWAQSIDALKYHVDTLLKLFFMQGQMPDLSFENMKGLGNIGYDARQMVLSDAHLKVGDESGPVTEFLERECNVIKAFLKMMNTEWADEVDNVEIEHRITPFIQNDEDGVTERLIKQNGGKPVKSQLDTIREMGAKDPQATLEQIRKEEAASQQARVSNLFNESAM